MCHIPSTTNCISGMQARRCRSSSQNPIFGCTLLPCLSLRYAFHFLLCFCCWRGGAFSFKSPKVRVTACRKSRKPFFPERLTGNPVNLGVGSLTEPKQQNVSTHPGCSHLSRSRHTQTPRPTVGIQVNWQSHSSQRCQTSLKSFGAGGQQKLYESCTGIVHMPHTCELFVGVSSVPGSWSDPKLGSADKMRGSLSKAAWKWKKISRFQTN